jgi:hypothetical protein
MGEFIEIEVNDEELVKKGYKPFKLRKMVVDFTDENSLNKTMDGFKKQIWEWYFKQSLERIKTR